MKAPIIAAVAALLLCGTDSTAQLAITEVMARASLETDPGPRRPDYFELTNFGEAPMDLDGYCFSDERLLDGLNWGPFTNLVVGPMESVVIFRYETNRSSVTTPEKFREWWGGEVLPDDVQIRCWEGNGLNGEAGGDELWIFDPQLAVVDAVRFGETTRDGRSFVYDPDSGVFGLPSVPGGSGVLRAELGDDYGSPGTTLGISPLRIAQSPSDLEVDAGADATFSVIAFGMPQPRCQWFHDEVELAGATGSRLVISNVQPELAGAYQVRVQNGWSEPIYSETAALTVNTNPMAPQVTSPPSDITVFPDQTAWFVVAARGFPALHYQWEHDGVEIQGATQARLWVANVTASLSESVYTVRVWNAFGSTNISAVLHVRRRPILRFTEVMSRAIYADSNGHYDWFELTNCDTNEVELMGYRFFDTPSFTGAFTITNSLVVKPSESVIFVEQMTQEKFFTWWGLEELQPELRVYTYQGFSLGEWGETLSLWNAAARDPDDTVATTSWAGATDGVSLECEDMCDETNGCAGMCLTDSIPGVNGAFTTSYNDVGSPGFTTNTPPWILQISPTVPGIRLTCRVTPGAVYRLSCSPTLPAQSWTPVEEEVSSSGFFLEIDDVTPASEFARFYRLEKVR